MDKQRAAQNSAQPGAPDRKHRRQARTGAEREGRYLVLGMSIGMAMGSGFGALFGQIAIGIGLGLCVGMAIGFALDAKARK